MKHYSRAPRKKVQRPALCRIRQSCSFWAVRVVDFSLSGALVSGLPPSGSLHEESEVEVIEGLENQQIQDLAPILQSGSITEIENYIKKLTRSREFRHSYGRVTRLTPAKHEFAITFSCIHFEERFYPRAQQMQPQLRGLFTYEEAKGRLQCRGKFTPGAAIDLASETIHDVRQCMLMLDMSKVQSYSRIAAEKFCNRLHIELTQNDLKNSLSLVVPEEWPEEHFPGLQLFRDAQNALDALSMPAIERVESTDRPTEEEAKPDEQSNGSDESKESSESSTPSESVVEPESSVVESPSTV